MDEPIARVGSTLCTSIEAEEVLKDINEFIIKFRQSDEYEEFAKRVRDENGFEMADIPTLTEGKKLRVGYIAEAYPEAYYDISKGEPAGYGIEFIKKFAYEYGYVPEFIECGSDEVYIKLAYNKVDIAVAYTSDVYRDETEKGGYAHMTEAFLYGDVVLLKLPEGQELKITGEIEY